LGWLVGALCAAPLQARAQTYTASVVWQPDAGGAAAGYHVYTRTLDAAYGAPLDAGLPAPAPDGTMSYLVADLDATVAHAFVVTAYASDGSESAFSNEITVAAQVTTTTTTTTTTTLPGTTVPPPWADQDIGAVGLPGSARWASGTFTVTGSGADIWNTADAFHYVYQSWTGDGQIVARVVTQQNTDAWAKAAVMIRQDSSAGSAHAMMIVTPGNGTDFEWRAAAGGFTTHTFGPAATAPYWIAVVRTGGTLTGYVSPDGATWTRVDAEPVALTDPVYIGLAVTSHNNAVTSTATFDNVAVGPVTLGLPPTTTTTTTSTTTTRPSTTSTTTTSTTTTTRPRATSTTTSTTSTTATTAPPPSSSSTTTTSSTSTTAPPPGHHGKTKDTGPCATTSCDATGTCETTPLPDGTPCPTADPCVTGVCAAGACVGNAVQAASARSLAVHALVVRAKARRRHFFAHTSLAATGPLDPAATGVTLDVLGADGTTLYQASLPGAAFHANRARTIFRYVLLPGQTPPAGANGLRRLVVRTSNGTADVVAAGSWSSGSGLAAEPRVAWVLRAGDLCARNLGLACSAGRTRTTRCR
jgi:hypothetical protein